MIDRILDFAPTLLREHGVFYLLTIAENKPDEILHAMSKRSMRGSIVSTTKAGSNEKIQILRMVKAQQAADQPTSQLETGLKNR